MYFTQVHENAIIDYCSTDNMRKKEELYNSLIQPAFSQMVDKIVFTYRFTTLPDIDDLREECKGWLVTILAKFDPNKGHKAFSYFSVVTKNWFIHKVKKNKKRLEREVSFQSVDYDVEKDLLDKGESYQEAKIREELMNHLKEEMLLWKDDFQKDSEKKVYEAVMMLFESAEDIDIFNKKAIYLYLRELTGLNTKQIVAQLNKMRTKYKSFRKDWDNGEI